MTDPTITLAGAEYPVRPLAVRQLRKVVPALLRLRTARFDTLTEGQFADLTEVAYQGALTGRPDLTPEAFDALPIKAVELIHAVPVVALQAGMVTGGADPGEPPAGSPTGT